MKIKKFLFLGLAVLYFYSFVLLLLSKQPTHAFIFWEANIWYSRIAKLVLSIACFIYFIKIKDAPANSQGL